MKLMYVYILLCNDNSYYTGVTNNIGRRFAEHQEGIDHGCYTYSRRPLKLVLVKEFDNPKEAIAFEKQVKGWSRAKKKALIDNDWVSLKRVSKNYTQYGPSTTQDDGVHVMVSPSHHVEP